MVSKGSMTSKVYLNTGILLQKGGISLLAIGGTLADCKHMYMQGIERGSLLESQFSPTDPLKHPCPQQPCDDLPLYCWWYRLNIRSANLTLFDQSLVNLTGGAWCSSYIAIQINKSLLIGQIWGRINHRTIDHGTVSKSQYSKSWD